MCTRAIKIIDVHIIFISVSIYEHLVQTMLFFLSKDS
nr:MAG TPA_asm: hypothetical protein [Bacteriophage sp.]